MASVADVGMIKNLFVIKEVNSQGIYAVNLYVRGKPWTIVVDDIFLMDKLTGLKAAQIGDDQSLWGPILEKAWAKIKGNYASADYGLLKNGIRAVTGAPVFGTTLRANSPSYVDDKNFKNIREAKNQNFIVNVQTNGGSDSSRNKYGIANGHAYSVLKAFYLEERGKIVHQLYMVRNPWSSSSFIGKWSAGDRRWTSNFISQVPDGVDPRNSNQDGVFFVDSNDFSSVFQYYVIGHYKPDYSISWFDQENDNGSQKTYYFELGNQGDDLYISVESYYLKSLPEVCIT